jgi:aromatic ring-cleaving dioxygenase
MKIIFTFLFAFLITYSIMAQTPGERVSAELEGNWINAEFLEFKIGLYRVKLDTDTTMWVTKDRIRLNYAIGDVIKAEWLGSWYPATIIEQKGNMYKVRFHEMNTEVLEWVKMEQMQKLK